MNKKTVHIPNRNGVSLSTSIEYPSSGEAEHLALFAHCFTCTSNLTAVRTISKALTARGIAVARFDFTGLGESGGAFSESHFEANVEDIEDVHTYLTEHFASPDLLIGHSLGGSASIVAASRIDSVKAVVTLGSPADIEHTTHHFADQIDELEEKGKTCVYIGGREFQIDKGFVDGFRNLHLPDIIRSLRKAILIMHSPTDDIVSIDNAQEIYTNAIHPKSFVSLDDADHLLTNKRDSTYAGNVIAAWASRYINE